MDDPVKFEQLVQFRVPANLSEAIDAAALRKCQSKSEHVRQSIVMRLEADGVDLATVSRLIPKKRAASRRLCPSMRTNCRKRETSRAAFYTILGFHHALHAVVREFVTPAKPTIRNASVSSVRMMAALSPSPSLSSLRAPHALGVACPKTTLRIA